MMATKRGQDSFSRNVPQSGTAPPPPQLLAALKSAEGVGLESYRFGRVFGSCSQGSARHTQTFRVLL